MSGVDEASTGLKKAWDNWEVVVGIIALVWLISLLYRNPTNPLHSQNKWQV